jgi:hypothetical protein
VCGPARLSSPTTILSGISGSCSVEYEDDTAVTLMMETINTSETLVNFDETTRRNIPEVSHLQEESFQLWK